jgi:hypothetical protein
MSPTPEECREAQLRHSIYCPCGGYMPDDFRLERPHEPADKDQGDDRG